MVVTPTVQHGVPLGRGDVLRGHIVGALIVVESFGGQFL